MAALRSLKQRLRDPRQFANSPELLDVINSSLPSHSVTLSTPFAPFLILFILFRRDIAT